MRTPPPESPPPATSATPADYTAAVDSPPAPPAPPPPQAPFTDRGGPVTTTGRPLAPWVVDIPPVLAHFIVDVPTEGPDADPAIVAFAALGPVEARVRQHYRGRVYAIRNVSEEAWATLAAWYSRGPHTLRENLRRAIATGDLPLPDGLVTDVPCPGVDAAADGDHAEALRRYANANPSPGPVSRLDAKARAFHEKWTVGYGHGSVGEHAVIRVCVDGCSLWAAKALEDARIGAAYTEKSTRYVPFDDGAQRPVDLWVQGTELGLDLGDTDDTAAPGVVDLDGSGEADTALLYGVTMQHWFECYRDAVARLTVEARTLPGVDDTTAPAALRGWVLDRARDLLPLGARTGLAMTLNARAFAHHVRRLGADTHTPEVRYLAAMLTAVGRAVCPALVRHTEPRDMASRREAIFAAAMYHHIAEQEYGAEAAAEAFNPGPHPDAPPGTPDPVDDRVSLGDCDNTPDGRHRDYARLAWAVVYEALAPTHAFHNAREPELLPLYGHRFRAEGVLHAWSTMRGPHEGLSRAAEAVSVTVHCAMSFGAWRDVQRHRMLTHLNLPMPGLFNGFVHDPAAHPGCSTLRPMFLVGIQFIAALEGRAGVPQAQLPPRDEGHQGDTADPIDTGGEDTAPPGLPPDGVVTAGAIVVDNPGCLATLVYPPARGAVTPTRTAALYALPLCVSVRPTILGTLRAWAQFVELRSRREGHDEYRRIAVGIGDGILRLFPGLHLRIDREPRTFARK